MTAYDELVQETRRFSGLFVGQLDDAELKTFERAVASGIARRAYEGASGFMGLAKVRLSLPKEQDDGK
jgi:hypothetical protein